MRKLTKTLLATAILGAGLAGCGGGGGSSTPEGYLTLSITDAPVHDADEVWVQFSGIAVKPRQGEAIVIGFDDPLQLDLMALTGENSAILLNDEPLPAGEYNWVRLDVDAAADDILDSYVMTDTGEMIELVVTAERGLQLSSGFTITQGATASFIIDWDLNQALTAPEGESYWKLRPALRITDEAEYGRILGAVAEELVSADNCNNDLAEDIGNTVYLFSGAGAATDDIDDDEGDPLTTAPVTLQPGGGYGYSISYVPPGEYTAAFTCQALGDNPDTDDALEFSAVASVTVADDRDAFADF